MTSVPLVVPEVNGSTVGSSRLIANPNCSTIPLALTLASLDRLFGLSWVSVSTYQSVSGAGRDAVDELKAQNAGSDSVTALPRRIAGNVIPEIGGFEADGSSGEETKIAAELRKIIGRPGLPVSATTVRVPVAVAHSEAVSFGLKSAVSRAAVAQALSAESPIEFVDGTGYATAIDVAGTDRVAVGRLRPDAAHKDAWMLWLVCDNLRKGAATNAVQIAETALAATVPA